jgi:predicted TPR repeat methyltransferase
MSQGVGHAKRFSAAVPSLQRRKGRGADEVAIATRLAAAKTDENPEAERAACLELARLLETRGLGLGSAAELLARASEILADADTFRKLSALEERLGRPARAADALARSLDLDPQPGARVRLGWLLLRAAEPGRAASAFVRAASESPEALAMELHGSLSFGGAREVSKEEGAGAYLDAAARRATAGQLDAELDDLARALALSPSPEGAERMARALERRDRAASADAFLESFVLAMPRSPERAEAARALREARLSRGDVPGALVMALAEGRSAGFDESFDELLLRAGLPELLAEHLGMCARRSPTEEERVRYLTERMRLYAGVLASPERALAATAELLALVPHHAEALARLSAYAEEGVVSPSGVAVLVERLARGEGLPAAFGAAVARLGETTDNPALVAVALRASLRSSDDAFARTAPRVGRGGGRRTHRGLPERRDRRAAPEASLGHGRTAERRRRGDRRRVGRGGHPARRKGSRRREVRACSVARRSSARASSGPRTPCALGPRAARRALGGWPRRGAGGPRRAR